MEFFSLGVGMMPEERLGVFPAIETADFANAWNIDYVQ